MPRKPRRCQFKDCSNCGRNFFIPNVYDTSGSGFFCSDECKKVKKQWWTVRQMTDERLRYYGLAVVKEIRRREQEKSAAEKK